MAHWNLDLGVYHSSRRYPDLRRYAIPFDFGYCSTEIHQLERFTAIGVRGLGEQRRDSLQCD